MGSACFGLTLEISSASFMAISSVFFATAFFERRFADVVGRDDGCSGSTQNVNDSQGMGFVRLYLEGFSYFGPISSLSFLA